MFLLAVVLLMLTELPKFPLGMIALSFIGLALLTMHNHTRKIGSMLLLIACAMFTAHTASADAIVAPMPIPACASEAVSGNTMTVDMVIYNITIAEMRPIVRRGFEGNVVDAAMGILGLLRQAANAPPPPSDADRDAIRSFTRLENEKDNGIVFTASPDAARTFLKMLVSRDKSSVLTQPSVATVVGTPAHIVVRHETQGVEMDLLPVRLEDGKVFTEIVVKRTEILDGKEVTNQMEMSVNLPTDNGTSLITGRKLGDKEVLLIVTATHQWQGTVPMAVAQSIYCTQ